MASRYLSLFASAALAALLFGATTHCGGSGGSGGGGGHPPGECVETADCNDNEPCTIDACDSDGSCRNDPLPDGDAPDKVQTDRDCKKVLCQGGASVSVDDPDDVDGDGNPCTTETCENGQTIHTPKGVGEPCGGTSCDGATNSFLSSACDAAGDCVDQAPVDCMEYTCDDQAGCPSTCANDGDCAGGFYCGAQACVAKKADGLSCGGANECVSDQCVDGVCCASACVGACKACNVVGSEGTCANVPMGTDPDNECNDPTPNCDGAGACM